MVTVVQFAQKSICFVVMALVLTLPQNVSASSCLKDSRKAQLLNSRGSGKADDDAVRLAHYLCRSDKDPRVSFRVQFQRLNALMAGVVLKQGKAPWLDQLYGHHKILRNPVLEEYLTLIQKFGMPKRILDNGGGEGTAIYLNAGAGQASGNPGDNVQSVYARKGMYVESFVLPKFPDIPLINETLHILNKTTWPRDISIYYNREYFNTGNPFNNVTAWRELRKKDFDQYTNRLQKYNQLISNKYYARTNAMKQSKDMLAYLTAERWPRNFLISEAQIYDGEGCIEFDFEVLQPELHVDLVVIENLSSIPLQIDDLLGQSRGGKYLRTVTERKLRHGNLLRVKPPNLIPSGARLIIPTALIFTAQDQTWRSQDAKQVSAELYAKIRATRPGSMLSVGVYSRVRGRRGKQGLFQIRKVRESFRPARFPEIQAFAFGPEWLLSGLVAQGGPIRFEADQPNFLQLAAGSEVGSCPILYAFDPADKVWFRHGKVIHTAHSAANKSTETVVFRGLVHQFRLEEEELERASIDEVRLTLELLDQRRITLRPKMQTLRDRDDGVEQIYAGDRLDIVFDVPSNITPAMVETSHLSITGYYERYGPLLAGRLRKPNAQTAIAR